VECFIKKWFRNGAPAGEVFIFTQRDAIILVYREGVAGRVLCSVWRKPARAAA